MMNLNSLIRQISKRSEIVNDPPVLMDLGASGSLNPTWEKVAFFCKAVAFDADDREFGFIEKDSSAFKKMYVYNCIVTDKTGSDQVSFYLTKSPYCSSTLKPLQGGIKECHYAELFEVREVVTLKAKNISTALQEMGISRIDWFKTDTQGTDLRLFSSLPVEIKDNCLIAEFEPGLLNVYQDEDKVSDLLMYMEKAPMNIFIFKILGPVNLAPQQFKQLFGNGFGARLATAITKPIPGWAEISYVNNFQSKEYGTREYILGWLFLTLQDHHPTAMTIISKAKQLFPGDSLINELYLYSAKKMRLNLYSLRSLRIVLSMLKEKILSKK
jgi:hypothetical protein